MKNLISIIVLGVLAVLAGVYFVMGPSVFLGGPSNSEIVRVARQAMIDSAPTEDAKKLAVDAVISPKGICNGAEDGGFACIVEVSAGGQPATSMVSVMKKTASGEWAASE